MRRFSKKLLAAGVVGIGVAGGGWWLVTSRPMYVSVAAIERTVPIRVFGLGTVEARIASKIGFAVGASITELAADHGDRVRRGDVLARLDAGEQEAKLARAKAILLSAEVAGHKARANVEKARAILAQKQEANRRKQALVGRSIVSEQIAEEARRDEDVAKAELAVALSEIEVAGAQLADAQAALAYERVQLERHTLVAPFDAMVVERHRERGAVVKSGDPIFTLIAPETVWVLAFVDESRAGGIVEGQSAGVRLRSLPQQLFEAKVVRIGIESDRVSEERRVYLQCQRCPPRFHLGEQAEVMISVATLDQALLVPEAAVARFDGSKGEVWTVESGRLQRREVAFRHRTEDARLELVAGLPDGAQVVTAIDAGFREGRAARLASEARR